MKYKNPFSVWRDKLNSLIFDAELYKYLMKEMFHAFI